MITVKGIREERQQNKATKEKLQEYIKFHFLNESKLTTGEDVAFRSELRKYAEALNLSKDEILQVCLEASKG